MSVAFLEVAKPLKQDSAVMKLANTPAEVKTTSMEMDEPTPGQTKYADDFLAKFDLNKDGAVVVAEVPRIVKDYSFRRIDADGNGSITRDELIAAARAKRGK
jgi:Ca2+-binding EF-hand superfamily protein